MRYFALFTVMAVLTGCSWETYKNSQGQTTLRQKYPTGTAVSYEDGTYSRNMRNNQYRPEQHAIPACPLRRRARSTRHALGKIQPK